MRYIRSFESFKNKRNELPVNEEFLGKLGDWFKGLWKKAVEGLKKLGDNPSTENLRKWVDDNPFNPSSETFLFKAIMEEFKKKEEANSEDCLTLIDKILDPESGAMGKAGLQPLYDNLLQAFGKNVAPIETVKFIIETIRNRAIKDYKYGGGPEFKVGDEAKINPDNKKMDLKDASHLPDYKKVLEGAGEDNKKRKEIAVQWVEKTLITRLDKYASEVTDDQVNEYLKSKNIEATKGGGDFEVGNKVVYKRDKFNEEEWSKLTDEDKKKPEEGPMKELQETKEMIGIKKISKIEGDKISFEDADFTKEKGDILMKIEVDENEESKKAAESLGKIKDDADKMKTVADLADMLGDDTKKDQVEQIKKIITGE